MEQNVVDVMVLVSSRLRSPIVLPKQDVRTFFNTQGDLRNYSDLKLAAHSFRRGKTIQTPGE